MKLFMKKVFPREKNSLSVYFTVKVYKHLILLIFSICNDPALPAYCM